MAAHNSDTTFATLHTEGTLLPPDLLLRIAENDPSLDGLTAGSYHRDGERLNEVINRAWNNLQGIWSNFRAAQGRLPVTDMGTTLTRDRWLLPLFRELDYGRLPVAELETIDGKSYAISHRTADCTPIHLVSFRLDLDRRPPQNGRITESNQHSSPYSLLQTYLNKQTDALWGFLSNGYQLRILRNNTSLTRQNYVEFDLQTMMETETFSDFTLLWLLCHQSRVEAGRDCWLERWSKVAQQLGTRALDHLRDGVQQAIESLGSGFLEHPTNTALRDRLHSGQLDRQDYFRQLLRIAYRLLFLFVAEDRELLYDPATPESARVIYRNYYSTQRLRRIAGKVRGDAHNDLWEALRLVMDLLSGDSAKDNAALGLPALGSFLFRASAVPDLIAARIDNRHLLDAVRALAFIDDRVVRALRPIDYRNLGSEEFGGIYESLLELHPEINAPARTFALRAVAGSERKTTGSYYTPTSLIEPLLASALDPLIDRALRQPNPKAALLALKICDPACGSGHFLIAAAHRVGKALAQVESGEDEPAPQFMRSAVRQVIGHCIYGVDITPDAVELCKVALWLNALEPGKSLAFLDHKIKCGNSLIGTTPELLEAGLPDSAFAQLEGDESAITTQYRATNRRARRDRESGQKSFLYAVDQETASHQLAAQSEAIDALADGGIKGQRAQEIVYHRLLDNPYRQRQQAIADAWCAAFVWPKQKGALPPIFDNFFQESYSTPLDLDHVDLFILATREVIDSLRTRYKFFHWHLEFPDVFDLDRKAMAGFDCVLGNPPWERIKIQEKEWFAQRNPAIAEAPNASARRRMIEALVDNDPYLLADFQADVRQAEGESHFIRNSGSYTLTGRGDVNTYALFAERNRQLINDHGRVGCIVPSGIATDDTTKFFFQDLMKSGTLHSLYDFENREGLFAEVHRSFKFCLLTLQGRDEAGSAAEFVFFAQKADDLLDAPRRFKLTADEILLINPNTRTCATFRSQRDAELTKAIYRRVPVLIREADPEDVNPWGIKFLRMFDMSNDSHLFHTRSQLAQAGYTLDGNRFVREVASDTGVYRNVFLPLYEAKLIHQFDHRWATYDGDSVRDLSDAEKQDPFCVPMPRYWIAEEEVSGQIGSTPYMLAFRDITNTTNERTAIASLIPRVAVGNKLPLLILNRHVGQFRPFMLADTASLKQDSALYANLTALVFDFIARQKLGGTTMNFFYVKQFPVLPPNFYPPALLGYIVPRVLELTYTAWDLQPFAHDLGYDGPPFAWDVDRRFQLRCELDALYFHLYGIARADVDYIMETFPIVKRKDLAEYGTYRTKETILAVYDELAITF